MNRALKLDRKYLPECVIMQCKMLDKMTHSWYIGCIEARPIPPLGVRIAREERELVFGFDRDDDRRWMVGYALGRAARAASSVLRPCAGGCGTKVQGGLMCLNCWKARG